MVHVFSKDEIESTKNIIDLELDSLLDDSQSQVAMADRLNYLYILMLSIAVVIILGVLGYTVIMYSKRK